jgi:hypothetical protein
MTEWANLYFSVQSVFGREVHSIPPEDYVDEHQDSSVLL